MELLLIRVKSMNRVLSGDEKNEMLRICDIRLGN